MTGPDPPTLSSAASTPPEDLQPFGFDLEEPLWLERFSTFCAVDELDDDGVARWLAAGNGRNGGAAPDPSRS